MTQIMCALATEIALPQILANVMEVGLKKDAQLLFVLVFLAKKLNGCATVEENALLRMFAHAILDFQG